VEGVVILLLVACVGKETVTPCDACDGVCELVTQPIAGYQHVDGEVDYPDPPPTSGDHDACWAEWGAHADPVPDENWVHNLEHGGVVFLWNCPQGCLDDAAAAEAWAEASLDPGRWVMTPYAEMDPGWAAVAWGTRLTLGCLDTVALQAFYDDNVGHGREDTTADPPAECEG
jgi:hypothetical protein